MSPIERHVLLEHESTFHFQNLILQRGRSLYRVTYILIQKTSYVKFKKQMCYYYEPQTNHTYQKMSTKAKRD